MSFRVYNIFWKYTRNNKIHYNFLRFFLQETYKFVLHDLFQNVQDLPDFQDCCRFYKTMFLELLEFSSLFRTLIVYICVTRLDNTDPHARLTDVIFKQNGPADEGADSSKEEDWTLRRLKPTQSEKDFLRFPYTRISVNLQDFVSFRVYNIFWKFTRNNKINYNFLFYDFY